MRRPRLNRGIEWVLRRFDNADRELVIRYRLWRADWFPHRTAELKGFDDDGNLLLGKWKWNKPRRWP